MSKVAPVDDVPLDEARDAFPAATSPSVSAAASASASGGANAPRVVSEMDSTSPPKLQRPIDRAKMNIRRGSKRMIQLFDSKPNEDMQLDIDHFYKARLRRRTHFHEEITGNLTRGGFDVPDTDAASPSQSRGIMMTLSPGEEYENYQKVNRATHFQQSSLLSDDPGEDDDPIPEGENENGGDERDGGAAGGGGGGGGTGGGGETAERRDRRGSSEMPRSTTGTLGVDTPSGSGAPTPLVLDRKAPPKPVDLDGVDSSGLRRLIRRNTLRSQARAFARSKKMINPHGRIRLVWDLMSIAFILYNAFVLPFRASFDASGSGQDDFDSFVDIFFIVDIFVMFNTAIEVDGAVKYSRRATTKSYLSGWFTVDVIAAIPYDSILPAGPAGSTSTLRRILKLLRLIRLLRLFRISRIFRRIQNAIFIRSTLTALFKYVLMVVFVSHWFSCIFHAIAASQTSGRNWIKVNRIDDPEGNKWDRYVAALYFSVMTLATIGFGDVAGTNADERLFSIFAMIVGGGIFAYGITNIVELVSSLTISETRFRSKMDEVNEYMAARDLPMKVRIEIREFYHNSRQSRESKLNGEQQILGELSSKLRSKIALSINDQFLRKFPFFTGSEPNFLMELALNMRMIHFAPLEDVLIEGEIGHEMFFIFRGAVEVLRGTEQIGILGENQYFGEMAILSADNRRRATVRTLCFCELRMLSRNRFLDALSLFPAMQAKMAQVARARQPPRPPTSPQPNEIQTDSSLPPPALSPPTASPSLPAAALLRVSKPGSPGKSALAPLTAMMPSRKHLLGSPAKAVVAEKPPSPDKQLPPPRLSTMKQQGTAISATALPLESAPMSASMRFRQNEQRKNSGFVPTMSTTAARLNNVVRRSSSTPTANGISSSMALALNDVAAKLEEATRRQEMLVTVIMKMQAELEKLQVGSLE